MGILVTKETFWEAGVPAKQMVPKAGLEPARPYGHYPLKIACLPISPRRQINQEYFTESLGGPQEFLLQAAQ